MSYQNTFIQVAADCPVLESEVPPVRGAKKPQHVLQYELLTEQPYTFDHESLTFEVYVRHKGLLDQLPQRRDELWHELFLKGHPCMRASSLTKRYGWGAHYDEQGRIAIYPMESEEYQRFVEQAGEEGTLLLAMRNKRSA